jgi:hypothetical protein
MTTPDDTTDNDDQPVDVTLDVHNSTLGQQATTPGDTDGEVRP